MAKVELYSASVCPFAQRSRMALLAKGVEFEVIEIDLQNKPPNFEEISPYSKVPVLKYGGDRVWESTIVNEYLEEVFPEPPLMPQEPGRRAIARIWIDFANTKFTAAFYKLLINQDLQQQQEWREEMTQHLHFMEQGLNELSTSGPYWLGESLSLVDIAFYPWFERWPALAHYRDLELPKDCPRLQQWWDTMNQHPAVQATVQPGDYHTQQYAKYANNTASGVTAREIQRY